jgi:hypothetical protein
MSVHICDNLECDWAPVKVTRGIKIRFDGKVFIFEYNSKTAGPYQDVYQLTPEELAEKLAVDLEGALAARLTALQIYEDRELTINDLIEALGVTVKKDDVNKVITFLAMLSAFTDNDQINLSFRAESSTGKSYIPLEVAALFPEDRVITVAYSSPTAFYHDKGTWDPDRELIIINLENKILIFLDQPHNQLLERLRPLLSHDQKELLYKVTDKTEKHGQRAKNVKIIGFPSVIFCTGRLALDEQEATRMILLSPEISQEKLREAVYLKILKEADERAFKEYVERDPKRKALRARIKRIAELKVAEIIVPEPEKIFQRFVSSRRVLKPRHSRDAGRLMALVKVLALLNYNHRRVERRGEWVIIYASWKDVEAAFQLYDQVAEPQELNLSPFVYEVYKQVIVPLAKEKILDNDPASGPTKVEICRKFLEVFGRPLQRVILDRDILPALEAAGLISVESHPRDRRLKIVKPVAIEGLYEETDRNVTSQGGVSEDNSPPPFKSTPPSHVTFLEGGNGLGASPYNTTPPSHVTFPPSSEISSPNPRNVTLQGGVSYNDRSDQLLISLLAQPQPRSDQPNDQTDQSEKQALQAVESRNSTPHPSVQLFTGVEEETRQAVPPEASPVAKVTGEPLEYSGPVCSDCIHWHALKCEKHPDWIVVTPTARYPRNCEYFVPKGEVAGRGG